MAIRNTDGPWSAPAAVDFSSAGIHTFVSLNSSGQVAQAGVGLKPFGLLDNSPTAGSQARVDYLPGIYKVIAGGTIAAGADVTVGANGKAIAAVTSGGVIVGTVAANGGVAGDVISIAFSRFLGTI